MTDPGRRVIRNRFYVVNGVGIDALVIAAAALILAREHAGGLAVAITVVVLVLVLAVGLRVARVSVVTDAHGVRVRNVWRSHRFAWPEVAGFDVYAENHGRFARRGITRGFLALACLVAVDGRRVALSAVSATGSVLPPRRFRDQRVPAIVAGLEATRRAINS